MTRPATVASLAVPALETMGAILCGGRSSRMGQDKATLPVDGVAMSARVAGALRHGGCRTVVAIGGDAAALTAVGLETHADQMPGEGPLGGIVTALNVLRHRAGEVLVAACDLPWLTAATVNALREGLAAHAEADVAVAFGARQEPLCAIWRITVLPELEVAFESGERAVHRALERFALVHVRVDAASVVNVNSTDDLVAARRHAQPGPDRRSPSGPSR